MSAEFLFTWLMVLLRTTGVILELPMLAGRSLPVMARIGLSMGLATLLAPIVPAGSVPLAWGGLVGAAAGELVLGLALGLSRGSRSPRWIWRDG